jgi:RHS repeat-associated protein
MPADLSTARLRLAPFSGAPTWAESRLKGFLPGTLRGMAHALATPCRVRRNRHRWRKTALGRQHYNYFRDYDPSTERYLQSDPIGLAGGVLTYGYGSAPLSATDSLGLYEAEASTHYRRVGRIAAFRAFQYSFLADDYTSSSALPGSHRGPADAFRHCVWSCQMARDWVIKYDGTKLIGATHEESNLREAPLGDQQVAEESLMDMHNNRQGRLCAIGPDGEKSCPVACRDKLYSGNLPYLEYSLPSRSKVGY